MANKTTKKFTDMQSSAILAALQDQTSEVTRHVLDTMVKKLAEARATYFKRPVASLPIGASVEHAKRIAALHPELREVVFIPNQAVPHAICTATRMLAVRRALLQILSMTSNLVENPNAHAVVLCGIEPVEHQFVYRTDVPMVHFDDSVTSIGRRNYYVADLFQMKQTIEEVITQVKLQEMAELIIVMPYDPRMWCVTGGVQRDAQYTFQWIDPAQSIKWDMYVGGTPLPYRFFSDVNSYKDWYLYIQPHGTSSALKLTRNQFMLLAAGVLADNLFHETRMVRNGFAEISFIKSHYVMPNEDTNIILNRKLKSLVPDGMMAIPDEDYGEWARMIPANNSRQYDLATSEPKFVRITYYEKAFQQVFRTPITRALIPSLMRSLHANSARYVYNGAVVTVEAMVDPETMCCLLEHVIKTAIGPKTKLSQLAAQARVPTEKDAKSFLPAFMSWAVGMSMKSADVTTAVQEVTTFLQGDGSDTHETYSLPPVQYGHPVEDTVDDIKAQYVQKIFDVAHDCFPSSSMPYDISRTGFTVDKSDTFAARLAMRKFAARVVNVQDVQSAYDILFPGNSMIDPTMRQVMAEQNDVQFTLDVQYFQASVPLMFSPLEGYRVIPSKLRTSVGADLMGSFRSLMGSLMKRNFNRPRPEAPGDRRAFVIQSVSRALDTYGNKWRGGLLAHYQLEPISVSREVILKWTERHKITDVLSAATMLQAGVPDPSMYRLMPKDIPKPSMSMDAQGAIMVGQTVVFHSKDVVALTAGAFTMIVSRLLALFPNDIVFAFGADEHTAGTWADNHLDMPDTYVYEIDVPKFDKSQDWACFELILHVMEMMGCDQFLLGYWRKASMEARICSGVFHLVFETMFGNRSGSGGTLAVNCIVLLFAYLSSFSDMGICGLLLKGDDSVLTCKRPMEERHKQYLLEHWGFTMKLVSRPGVVTFCSSIFVKDSNNKYQLVRDVVRVIEKMGRALSVDKTASYFLDYYVSVFDTALQYSDTVLVQNLQVALTKVYGVAVDVNTMVQFVQYVGSSTRTFLSVLYGLTADQITNLHQVDDAFEAVVRTRTTRYVKSKDMADTHKRLRLSFIQKLSMSSDWTIDAAAEGRHKVN